MSDAAYGVVTLEAKIIYPVAGYAGWRNHFITNEVDNVINLTLRPEASFTGRLGTDPEIFSNCFQILDYRPTGNFSGTGYSTLASGRSGLS